MKGFGVTGFNVSDCDIPLSGPSEDEFCKNSTLWRDYYHYHKHYNGSSSFSENCLSFRSDSKRCSNNSNIDIGVKPPEPDNQVTELLIQSTALNFSYKIRLRFLYFSAQKTARVVYNRN